jgi:hypothetical protein
MRTDLTESQIKTLLSELRTTLKPPQMQKVQSLVNELQALRERESVTRYLAGIEGAV